MDDLRISNAINRVFYSDGLGIGRSNPISLHTNPSSIYRVTGNSQIEDIIECGFIRPKIGKVKGGHSNEVFWSIGGEKTFYYDKRPVLEVSVERIKDNQIGALSINDLSSIWIFDENQQKYVDNLEIIKKQCQEKQQEKEKENVETLSLEKNESLEIKSLEDIEDIMSEQGYTYFGHGVGNGEDVDKIVSQIFNEGLRTKNNSLCLTTIGLDTPTPELKMMYQEIGLEEPSMNSLKQKLDNWEHKDSKKIILIRVPTEYINRNGNGTDMNGEMYGAFMSEKQHMDGKSTNYLDPNFIIGCYDSSTGDVELNKSFERTLSSETLSKIQTRFQNAINKVKARSSTFNEIEHSLFNEQEQHVNLRKYKNSLVDNLDVSKKAIDDIIAEFNYENQNEISTGGVSI